MGFPMAGRSIQMSIASVLMSVMGFIYLEAICTHTLTVEN